MSSAQPKMDRFWRGSFNIHEEDIDIVEGLVAHLSTKAASEASTLACLFPTSISYKFLPSAEVWPRIADRSAPIEEEIDLYFFPENGSNETDYYKLLNKMFTGGYTLRAKIGSREMLVFTSVLLPSHCKRLEKKHYLWGIFMENEVLNHPCCEDEGSSSSASVGCQGDSELVSNPAKEVPLDTVGVLQRQLTEDSNNNSMSSDQSTDAAFLRLLNAFNEQEESADTDIISPSLMHVGSYSVEASLGPTLQAIFDKYGDISESCPIKDTSARSRFLEELCRALKELEGVKFAGCPGRHLRYLDTAVARAENVGLNVAWLRQQHDKLSAIRKGIKDFPALKKDLVEREIFAESMKTELELKEANNTKLDEEMKATVQQLASIQEEQHVFESKARHHLRNAKKFLHRSLADGLL